MNKLLYIISAASALMLASCTNIFKEEGIETVASGEKTSFEFCVDLGDTGDCDTKALTENAQVKNLYVAVFDGNGYKLSEYVKAELVAPAAGDNNKKYKYSVELTVASGERILHFIANAPKKLSYGSEGEVIGSLYTQLSNDDVETFQEAYWQRIKLDKIPAKPAAGEDDTEYKTVAAKLDNIKLIRNYSKITFQKKADETSLDNFNILGIWLINQPDRGTIAPYNRNTGLFMSDYLTYTKVADMESATGGNYQGFMLAETKFLYPSESTYFIEEGTGKNMIDATSGVATAYVYEREKALVSPMYLIVKATYNGSATPCYYKVALQNSEGEFYSMLRNFNYLIEIQSVAKAGESSAYKALLSAPSGDISLNVEYQDITSISDGEARMSVNETTIVLVGDVGEQIAVGKDNGEIPIWYEYIPDVSTPTGRANDLYSDTVNPGVEIDITSEIGSSGPVIAPKTGQTFTDGVYSGQPFDLAELTGDTGHKYIEFSSYPISDVRRNQTIIVTGKYKVGNTLKTITRKINLILRKKLDMELICGPDTDNKNNGHVADESGKPVTVTIGIETDLPSSMFPMDFAIEAANRTLTPNGDVLPVKSGTSTILAKDASETEWNNAAENYIGRPSYWFIKTLTYEEYSAAELKDGKKYFTANFKTNVGASATDIYVSQSYFNQAKVNLSNYTPSKFTSVSLSKSIMEVENEATFNFTLGEWATNPARKVTLGLARFEELTKSGYTKQLEYKGSTKETIDGVEVNFDLYEMTATTAANSIRLKAYQDGIGYVKIMADKYDSEIKSAEIYPVNIPFRNATIKITSPSGFASTADGEPYAGQSFTTTLTANVRSGSTVSDAKVYGQNATANISGTTLTITYTTSLSTSKIYDWPVTASITYGGQTTPLSESVDLYVWTKPTYTRQSQTSTLSNDAYIMITPKEWNSGIYFIYENDSNQPKLSNSDTDTNLKYIWQIKDWNNSTNTGKLMNYASGRYLESTTNNSISNTNTTSTEANYGTFNISYNSTYLWQIRNTGTDNAYMNRHGGGTSTNVGYYYSDTSSDSGSRWVIYSCTVYPASRPTE